MGIFWEIQLFKSTAYRVQYVQRLQPLGRFANLEIDARQRPRLHFENIRFWAFCGTSVAGNLTKKRWMIDTMEHLSDSRSRFDRYEPLVIFIALTWLKLVSIGIGASGEAKGFAESATSINVPLTLLTNLHVVCQTWYSSLVLTLRG